MLLTWFGDQRVQPAMIALQIEGRDMERWKRMLVALMCGSLLALGFLVDSGSRIGAAIDGYR